MNPDPVLSLRNVTKTYGTRPVLDRLCLEVPAGSVLGLLGKNGAGKTTLLKCALGLLRPQHGEACVFGEPAWDLSAAAKSRLGYVPQVIELYGWMRIEQILAYTASFYENWNHGLVNRLVRDWELDAKERVGTLSVGNRQKLSILLAIGHEPDLLILDEPAASLDPVARREFLATVLDIADTGRRTVLFSTHITSDIERVADRVALLRNGRIVYDGELDALKDAVKRIHVRSAEPLPVDLHVPGLLRRTIHGPQAVLSVQGATPELIHDLESRWHASVQVQDLNLEDIFLEMHDE
jgi:ABC-2 type transport system ATP-binding protein